ncbi:YdcF family protein [Vibrio sp. FNV 38]|nr:YdcF family protein [Vibrio sp. FNV 38]
MRLYQSIDLLWDYMQIHHTPVKSDCIVVFCSNDVRVAFVAARLYQEKVAPKILFSGGFGRFTHGLFEQTEAETFAEVARTLGVPDQDMILETTATNSGENVSLSAQLLEQQLPNARRFTLVQKPFMERRAMATFEAQWPRGYDSLRVVSQAGTFLDYLDDDIFSSAFVINAILEDFERIKAYPALGFLIQQAIPPQVEQAYQTLLNYFPRT